MTDHKQTACLLPGFAGAIPDVMPLCYVDGLCCEHCQTICASDLRRFQEEHARLHGRKLGTVGYPDSLDCTVHGWLAPNEAAYDVLARQFGASGICNCGDCRRLRREGFARLAIACPTFRESLPDDWSDARTGQRIMRVRQATFEAFGVVV